ncbi:MAG: hypothetical protein DLM73_12075 [Chthoniobacterales bacterium]|nr:MAG: hypothetical protein DLM73_12075 [Chthoniobacterales bacterium]
MFFRLYFAAGLLALGALFATPGPANAQTPVTQDVDRAQLLRNQSLMHGDPYSLENGVDNGQAVASPNDRDLGEQEILKRVERYEPFSVSVATPFYYTTNVALAHSGEQGDLLFAPAAAVTYAPRFTRTFFGSFTVQQQSFYYDRFSGLNFGSFDFRAGLVYILPTLHNLMLRGEYDYNRLTFSNSFNEFFSNHSIFLNAELPFRIGRAQQFSLGTDANISVHAEPSAPRRHEFDFYAGYAVSLTRSFSVDAVGRIFVRDYSSTDRTDVSEILAISANYRVTKCFSASAASTFAWSQSNKSVFDYKVANIGGALSLNFKF